jgi:mannose-1-phosphate guanylyltransferase/mannose-6-phosphate isomerase
MSLLPVILSGGSGTRLWPLSREHYPKQLLPLVGDDSLLQATVLRLDGLPEVGEPLLICNEDHRFIVAEQVRALGRQGAVLLEPVGRNTAPAMTLAALWALHEGADPVMVVMPADHVILDGEVFRDAVRRAAVLAEAGLAVTFGITPDCPETGYGYIQRGVALAGDQTASGGFACGTAASS